MIRVRKKCRYTSDKERMFVINIRGNLAAEGFLLERIVGRQP